MNYPAIPSQGDESNKGSQNFQVCVRIRPLTTKEEQQTTKKFNSVISVQDNMLFLYDPNENSIKDIITNNQSIYNNPQSQHSRRPGKEFIFDHVFPEQTTTEQLFNECVFPSVDHILNGYNSTIFAYGMTGAGKTHTIFGNLSSSNETEGQVCGGGIAVMMIQALLDKAKQLASQVNFKFSYLEIYNENIRDLMVSKSDNLMVIEDADKGVFVPDLTDYVLEAADDIKRFITNGNTRRVMASTAANTFSSRSHAIIQILCEQINHGQNLSITSKLSIVDLAGSERAASTENRGLRLTEGANINRSLLALGNCINLLSDATKKGSFVPYRDSKLTRLLKESLGGNTRSTMLACVSPSCLCYDETLNTLKYATRAKFIKKTVSKNSAEMSQHVDQYKSIIAGLRTEIVNLKQQLSDTHQENISLKNQHKIISQYNSNNSNDSSGSSHYKNNIPGSSSSRNSDRNKATKSVDEIGELLIDNLEEQWEIKNTISEIINLNKSSEEYIFEQDERSKRQALTDQQRREITNEISKRREVINSNEQILAEMNQKLQENAAKKKELQIMMQQTAAGQTDREYMNQPFSIDVDVKSATIQQLHEQVMRMQEELQHKDQLLKQKQLIIQDLTAKEPGERQTAGRGTIQQGQAAKKKGISISNNSSTVYTDKSTGNIIPNNNQPSSSSSISNQRQPPSGSSSSSNSQSSSIQSSSQQPNKDNNNARKFYLKIPKEMISERASSKNHFTNNSSTVSVSSCTSQANSSGLQISNNIKDLKRPMSINNAKNNRSNNSNNNYTPAGTTVSSNNRIDSNPGQSWGEYDSCADDDGNRLHRKIRDASVKVPHKDNNNNNSTYLKAKIARNNYQNSQENQQVQSQRRPATSKITNNSTSSSSARSEAIQQKNNITQKEPRERHSSTRKTTSNLSTNITTTTTNHTLSTQQSTGKTTNVVSITCSNNNNDNNNNNNSGFKQQTPRAVGLFNVSDIQLPTSHSNSAHTMEISLLELKQHAQKLKDADLNDKQELRQQEGLNLDDLESYQIVEKRDQSSASNLNNILNGQQQQNSQCSSLVDVQMIMRRLNQKVDERIAASSAMISDEQAKKNIQIDGNYCSNGSYYNNYNNNSSNFTENCQQNIKNIQNSRTKWNGGSNNNIDMQLNQQQPYLDGNIIEKPLVQGYERSTRQSHREEADCQILNYPQTNINCKQVFSINSQQQQGQQQQIALNKSNRSASCLKLCGGNDYELNSYAFARKKARELKQKGNNIMDENSSKIYFEGEINNVLNGLSAQNLDNNSSSYNNNNNKGSQLQQLLNNGISNQQNNIQNSNIYYEQIHQGDQQSQLFSSSTIVSARRNIQSEDIMISNENSQPGSTSSVIGNSNTNKQMQNMNINVDGGIKKIPGMSQNSVNNSSNRNTPNGNSSYVQQQQMRLEKQRGENPCLKNISNNFSQLPPTTTGSPGMNTAVNNSNKMQHSQVPRGLLSQFNVNYAETLNYSKKTAMTANGGSSKSNNSQRNSVRQRDNSPKTAKNRGTSKSYLQQDTFSGNSSQSNEVIDFSNQLVLQSSRRTEPTEGYFNEYKQTQLQQQQQESAFLCQYSSQSSLNYV